MFTAELKGLPQALAGLKQFSHAIERKHSRIAVMAGGGVLRDEAKKLAPRETGLIKRSLIVKGGADKKGNAYSMVGAKRKFTAYVEPGKRKLKVVTKKGMANLSAKAVRRKPSRYIHLVHGGTRRHEITAKKAKFLSDGRGTVFGRTVRVSSRPKEFLALAVRSKGSIAILKAIRKVNEGIEIERRKALAKARTR